MAELYKTNYKRVFFQKSQQKIFLQQVCEKIRISSPELAKIAGISLRTLNDWRREKFSMSLPALKFLCKKAKVPIPENVELKDSFWYTKKGALLGGCAVYKKYGSVGGDPAYRMKKWYEWWNKEGKFKIHFASFSKSIHINKPRKSKDLAELVGIILGDGSITKNQVIITLHRINDFKYSKFVIKLIKKILKINPKIYYRNDFSVLNIVISRVELVRFCVKSLGLKIGNKVKQQIDVPGWIMKNKNFKIACLRGLLDTDGSLIVHKYKSKGKFYIYKKVGFTSRSFPLLNSVHSILNELKIRHGLRGQRDIRIENKQFVEKYFKKVGSHNPKHIKRYLNYFIGRGA